MKLAIFDFDGTLFPQDTLPFFLKQWKKYKYPRGRRYFTGLSLVGIYVKYRLGKSLDDSMRKESMKRFTRIFSGMSKKEFRDFLQRSSKDILPKLSSDIVKEVKRAKASGFHIVLLSGCYETFLKFVGESLGIDTVIGTETRYKNGCIDVKTTMEVMCGDLKSERLGELFQDKPVDWNASCAYADSDSDIKILEMVGKPVAVNPDSKLKKKAEERGWRVIAIEPPAKKTGKAQSI